MSKRITVLGGGPGGYVAAIKGAHNGACVTLIEKETLGGTCLNWGCIPTKTYVEKVGFLQKAIEYKEMGVQIDSNSIELKTIKDYKDQVVSQLVKGVETLVHKNKINLIKGVGKVLSPRQVEVNTGDDVITVDNDYLILATGSVPAQLPILGMDLPQILDSKGILELEKIPEKLVVVGGGVIGVEFAQIFARLGSKVTVIEILSSILPGFDSELVRRLQPLLKKGGIELLANTKVTSITPVGNDQVEVHVVGKKEDKVIGDNVLFATGRQPNLEGIKPEQLGLEMDGKFIKVNGQMSTNLPQVYAIGDLVSSPMLAHIASYEGEIAIKAIMGKNTQADYTAVPSCIYIDPELAGVGITEEQAKEQGISYQIGKFPFSANGRAVTKGSSYGMVKIIADQNTGVVLGGHILGPQASELIHNLTLAIRWKLTVDQIGETIHGHPTLSEAIMESAHSVFDKAVHAL